MDVDIPKYENIYSLVDDLDGLRSLQKLMMYAEIRHDFEGDRGGINFGQETYSGLVNSDNDLNSSDRQRFLSLSAANIENAFFQALKKGEFQFNGNPKIQNSINDLLEPENDYTGTDILPYVKSSQNPFIDKYLNLSELKSDDLVNNFVIKPKDTAIEFYIEKRRDTLKSKDFDIYSVEERLDERIKAFFNNIKSTGNIFDSVIPTEQNFFNLFNSGFLSIMIDASNISLSNIFRNTIYEKHHDYIQWVEQSNKYDMAPTSKPNIQEKYCSNPTSVNYNNYNGDVWIRDDAGVSTNTFSKNLGEFPTLTLLGVDIPFGYEDNNGKYSYTYRNVSVIPDMSNYDSFKIPCLSGSYIYPYNFTQEGDICYGNMLIIYNGRAVLFKISLNKFAESLGVGVLKGYITNQSPNNHHNILFNNLGITNRDEQIRFLYDLKRCGDWGQIHSIYGLREKYPNINLVLVTNDRLAFMYAKLVNIPCILTSPSNKEAKDKSGLSYNTYNILTMHKPKSGESLSPLETAKKNYDKSARKFMLNYNLLNGYRVQEQFINSELFNLNNGYPPEEQFNNYYQYKFLDFFNKIKEYNSIHIRERTDPLYSKVQENIQQLRNLNRQADIINIVTDFINIDDVINATNIVNSINEQISIMNSIYNNYINLAKPSQIPENIKPNTYIIKNAIKSLKSFTTYETLNRRIISMLEKLNDLDRLFKLIDRTPRGASFAPQFADIISNIMGNLINIFETYLLQFEYTSDKSQLEVTIDILYNTKSKYLNKQFISEKDNIIIFKNLLDQLLDINNIINYGRITGGKTSEELKKTYKKGLDVETIRQERIKRNIEAQKLRREQLLYQKRGDYIDSVEFLQGKLMNFIEPTMLAEYITYNWNILTNIYVYAEKPFYYTAKDLLNGHYVINNIFKSYQTLQNYLGYLCKIIISYIKSILSTGNQDLLIQLLNLNEIVIIAYNDLLDYWDILNPPEERYNEYDQNDNELLHSYLVRIISFLNIYFDSGISLLPSELEFLQYTNGNYYFNDTYLKQLEFEQQQSSLASTSSIVPITYTPFRPTVPLLRGGNPDKQLKFLKRCLEDKKLLQRNISRVLNVLHTHKNLPDDVILGIIHTLE